ncbi:MAG: NAD(P)/FAD-dependent oxidoreductase [Candidatus Binataceae bacterium]
MNEFRAGGAPHVVIVGGGFAGLNAAKELRSAPVRVTVVDRRNHHLFQPLLYQVATAALNPSEIASPIRRILRHQRNAAVILGDAEAVDTARRCVILRDGELAYDFLIVATGATHSYFGHDEWAQAAPGLKTIEDALEIRRRVLIAFEVAERALNDDARRGWLTFAIIGAGPTGVEMAGALAEISRRVLDRDFRHIQPETARVVLIEAAERVLPAMSEVSSTGARRQLERLGVEVITARAVTNIDDGGVTLAGGERIATRTAIWAAGVTASPLARSLGVPLDRAGRVIVQPDLTVTGAPEVYVVGDLASFAHGPIAVPGMASAAIQEGRHAARNIVRTIRGTARAQFRYRNKGLLATVGRAAAVAEFGRVHLQGFAAWLVWLLVHIFYLIGFRNRVFVIAQWAWVYLRFERGARLITGDPEPLIHRGELKEGKGKGSG